MLNKTTKLMIITLSIIFAVRVITVFTANRLYSISFFYETGRMSYEKGISLLKIAEKLDSTNVELYKREYNVLSLNKKTKGDQVPSKEELQIVKKMINLSPLWPSYHAYYALTLNNMIKMPNVVTDSLILVQLKEAYELKPFSEIYQELYQKYLNQFKLKYGQDNLPEYICSSEA